MISKVLSIFVSVLLTASAALAGNVPDSVKSTFPPPEVKAKTWLLMDYNTGWVLAAKDADIRIEPASLSKLMTAYVVFKELEQKSIRLDDQVLISTKAWKTEGSRMFAEVNTRVSVEDLLKGLIIQSGNDAAVALAEHVAGSEDAFASRMNEYAQKLGLENSHFQNAPGLPHPEHYSTARDLTMIAAALIRQFPQYYALYSQREFTYNDITQQNRNLLLYRDPTADGVKTGYTKNAGYCLIGSAKRDGMRLIATVTGTTGKVRRAKEAQALLSYGFTSYESQKLLDANSPAVKIKVYKGEVNDLGVGVREPLYLTVPRGQSTKLVTRYEVPESIVAPVGADTVLGKLLVSLNGERLMEFPLKSLSAVNQGSWWQNIIDSILLLFQ